MIDYSGQAPDMAILVAQHFRNTNSVVEQCLARAPIDSKVSLFREIDSVSSVIDTDYFRVDKSKFNKSTEGAGRLAIETKLLKYSALQPNWDGYNGRPPKEGAIFDAVTFLRRLPSNIKLPKEMVAGDGDVGLYWNEGSTFVELGFNGSGKYYFYAEDENGEATGDDLFVLSKSIPQELLNRIFA
jgi:hypothetical protein